MHGPLPTGSVLTLASGLADGLAAIHAAGLVHGELNPTNVLLAEDGPSIINLGACEARAALRKGIQSNPRFMSPERLTGRDVGPPIDIFGLGGVLAFAATGEGPFDSEVSIGIEYRIINTAPNLDRLPDELRSLVGRCLAKDPALRPTAAHILAEMGSVRPGPGWLPEAVIGTYATNPVATVAANAGDADMSLVKGEPTDAGS